MPVVRIMRAMVADDGCGWWWWLMIVNAESGSYRQRAT
jgi:hypothetical protein